MPFLYLIAGYVTCTTTGDVQRFHVCVFLGMSLTALDSALLYVCKYTLFQPFGTLLICTLLILAYVNFLLLQPFLHFQTNVMFLLEVKQKGPKLSLNFINDSNPTFPLRSLIFCHLVGVWYNDISSHDMSLSLFTLNCIELVI